MNIRGPKPKIPPALHPLVLAKIGEGISYEAICVWLEAEHKVSVTEHCISRLVRRDAKQNGEVVKAELRRKLRKIVGTKFDRLAQLMRRAKRLELAATGGHELNDFGQPVDTEGVPLVDAKGFLVTLEPKQVQVALRAIREQANLIDLAYHYAGADDPDERNKVPPKDEASRALVSKMQRLIESVRSPVPGAASSTDGSGEVH